MKRYFGKFASSGDVQTAVDSGALSKPYVAVVGNEVDYNSAEPDYSKMPLTFEILSAGTIGWKSDTSAAVFAKTIEYSKNDGPWISITSSKFDYPTINVVEGDIIQFRGNNTAYGVENWSDRISYFEVSVKCKAYGNIMSMITTTGYETATTLTASSTFEGFFKESSIVDASNLVLPATTLSNHCYAYMFYHSILAKAPVLPAASVPTWAYWSMFSECANLNYVKCLATDISASQCVGNWLNNVSATGTFVKHPSMNNWPSGANGIPNGWTVVDAVL